MPVRKIGENPRSDWYLMLICALLVTIVLCAVDFLWYARLILSESEAASSSAHVPVIDRAGLAKTVEGLFDKERAAESPSSLLNDPSF